MLSHDQRRARRDAARAQPRQPDEANMLPPPAHGVPVAAPAGNALLQRLDDLAEYATAIEQAVTRVAQQMQEGITNDADGDFIDARHHANVALLHRVIRNLERSGTLFMLAAVFYFATGLALLVLWPLHRACAWLLLRGGRCSRTRTVVARGGAILAVGASLIMYLIARPPI